MIATGFPEDDDEITHDSRHSMLVEFTDAENDPFDHVMPGTWTAVILIHMMRERVRLYGSPLPDGFVAPPGIDIEELLKQVPWPS